MNERIKELAIQAGGGPSKWYTDPDVLEYFAELIARECADLIDNKVTITAEQTYDEVFVAKYDTRELSAKQIREHFAVDTPSWLA
jgi:hypothetical protein